MLTDYEAAMKAASDRTRVRILKMLQQGELCVCQLMAVLAMSSSTVSKHLSILKMAGLLRDRRDGRWVYYALENRTRNPYASAILQNLQGWLSEDPDIVTDKKKLADIRQTPLEEMCVVSGRVQFTPGEETQ